MVSVVSGSGLGLVNTSRGVVGANGELGQGSVGRAGERLTVNAANGNLVVQNQDGLLVGVGPDVGLVRTYNSQGGWDGDNNDAWRVGFYRRIAGLTGTLNTAGSTLRRVEADGNEAVFTFRDGRYVGTEGAGAYDTLVVTATTATWTDGDSGVTETYLSAGSEAGTWRLTQITDTEGHSVRVGYDATKGVISTLATFKAGATTADETVTLVYDANKRLTQVDTSWRDDAGPHTRTLTRYTYHGSGRLQSVITDLTPDDRTITDAKTYTVTYGYDSGGRLNALTQSDGTSLTILYEADRVKTITDALGRVTTFTYDTANRRTTVTDARGQAAVLGYDIANRLTSLGGAVTPLTLGYDGDGNILTSTDGLNRQTLFVYDARGNLTRSTDASGRVLDSVSDAANRQTSQTQYTELGTGGTALTTRYVYDTTNGLRRLRFVVSAEGRVTEQQYNSLGQVLTRTSYATNRFSGDATLAALTTWAGQQPTAGAAVQRQTYTYDLRGALRTQSDGRSTTTFVYDPFGRLVQTIDPQAGSTTYGYDGMDRLLLRTDSRPVQTVYAYDDAGRTSSITWANGLRDVSTYDTAGQLVTQAQFNGSTALGQTRYAYDKAGRLRMVTDPTGQRRWQLYDEAGRLTGTVDAQGHLTEITYDAAGRAVLSTGYAAAVDLTKLVDAQGTPIDVAVAALRPASDPNDRRQWSVYDDAGRLLWQVNSVGEATETRYDGAGRVVAQVQHGQRVASLPAAGSAMALATLTSLGTNASEPDHVSRSFYDGEGLLRGTLDAEGYLTELRYDAAGRLVERIAYATATPQAQRAAGTLAALTPAASDDDRRSLGWFDAQGRTVAELDADGFFTEHTYNNAGQRIQTQRYVTGLAVAAAKAATPSTDPATLRPAASTEDHRSSWTYDTLGRVRTETGADGAITQFTYDDLGRLTRSDRALGTTDQRSSLVRYDTQGRVIAELSALGAAQLKDGQTQAQVDAIWAAHSTQYAYDTAGRRIRSTDALGQVTLLYYDTVGRLAYRITKTDQGGEVEALRYNAFGEVRNTQRYTKRLAVADTTALQGGLATAALDQKIDALADLSDRTSSSFFNTVGRLTQAMDALGNKTDYVYDAFGQLSRSAASIDADGGTLRRLVTQITRDRRGLATTSTQDPSGLAVVTRTEYDAFGRVTASIDGLNRRTSFRYVEGDGKTDGGRQVVITDATGAQRGTTYDAFDRSVRQTDALGNSVAFQYNTSARRLTLTTASGVVTVTDSNAHGQVIKVSDAQGTSTYEYDANGNRIRSTDALGNVVQDDFDAINRLKAHTVDPSGLKLKTSYEYDTASRVLAQRVDPDGLNLTTRYEYDGQGRAVRITDPSGVVTRYDLDGEGRLKTQVVDEAGLKLTTRTTYDAQGRVLTVRREAGTTVANASAAQVTEYHYDLLGRRTQEVVDPAGLKLTTSYDYDAAGQVVRVSDTLGVRKRYVYDAAGRETYCIDALGGTERKEYDAEGQLLRSTHYANAIATGGLPVAATSAQIQALLSPNAGADLVERRSYNKDGRLRFVVDAQGGVSETRYDSLGRVSQSTAYAALLTGADLASAMDLATTNGDINTLVGKIDDAGRDRTTRLAYDGAGRLRFTADAVGAVTETVYDPASRAIRTTQYARTLAANATVQAPAADARDRTTRTVYDAAGRAVQQVDAEGHLTVNQYDNTGNLSQTLRYASRVQRPEALAAGARVALLAGTATPPAQGAYLLEDATLTNITNFLYDRLNRRTLSIDVEQNYETTAYNDALGARVQRRNTLGGEATLVYDPIGRLVQETLPVTSKAADGTQQPVVNRYEYDVRGNRTKALQAFGLPEQRTTLYRYDAMNRLVRTIGMAYNLVDAADNTSLVTPVDVVRYNALGQAVEETTHATLADPAQPDGTTSGGRTRRSFYDTAGRKAAELAPDNVLTRFGYDGLGNLLTRSTDGGTDGERTLRFAYDLMGRKTQTRIDGAWTWELGQPLTLNDVADGAATPQTLTLETLRYDAFGDLQRRTDARGNASFTYHDRLGRTQLQIDAAGYATAWDYDRPGAAATRETRYGRAVPIAYGLQSNGTTAQAVRAALAQAGANPDAADRVTQFTLDRLGRVTERAVLDVAFVFSPTSAAVGTTDSGTGVASAVTRYSYDGMGHVTRISERIGIQTFTNSTSESWQDTDISYDALGREIQRKAPGFIPHFQTPPPPPPPGAPPADPRIRPTTDIEYDGLGQVVRNIRRGLDNTTETDDRITRYVHDGNGRPLLVIDAENNVMRHDYDANGDAVRLTYLSVLRSDGTRRNLAKTIRYDTVGRQVETTDLDTGETRQIRYNAFGETVAQGNNGGEQEWFEYDVQGQVIKTNSGDGTVKFYLRDANGNVTREIRAGLGSSTTRDLRSTTLAEVLADPNFLSTVHVYDARNQEVRTIQTRMARLDNEATLAGQFTDTWVPQRGDLNGEIAGTIVTPGHTTATAANGGRTPLTGGVPGTAPGGSGNSTGAAVSVALPSGSVAVLTGLNPSNATIPLSGNKSEALNQAAIPLQIPSSWPAGRFRVIQTATTPGPAGTTTTTTVTEAATAGGGALVGGGFATGTAQVAIEWQPSASSVWQPVAQLSFTKGTTQQLTTAIFTWTPVTNTNTKLYVDLTPESGWGNAARFQLLVDPDDPALARAMGPSHLAGGRLGMFDLAGLPATASGDHQLVLQAFDSNGRLVGGRKFKVTGTDASTLAEASGDATLYAGGDGTAWAKNGRAANGQVLFAMLTWDLGPAHAGDGTLRWRKAGATAEPWNSSAITAPSGGSAFIIGGPGTAIADGSYFFVVEQGDARVTGTFTLTGGVLTMDENRLKPMALTPERVTLNGPVDSQGRGRVALTVGSVTVTATTDANGQASFDLSQIRQSLGLDRWSVSSQSFNTQGYLDMGNGQRQLTHAEHGTLALRAPRVDGNNTYQFTADSNTEYEAEAVVTVPSTAGTIRLTPVGGTAVTLTLGSDWRLVRNGNELTINLDGHRPAWGAADQLVDWAFTGSDGKTASGRLRITDKGVATREGAASGTPKAELRLTPPAGTTGLALTLNLGNNQTAQLNPSSTVNGTRVYDLSAYRPTSGTRTLSYTFRSSGANGAGLTRGSGTFTLAADGTVISTAFDERRAINVALRIDGRDVPQARLNVSGVGNVTLTGTWVPPAPDVPGDAGHTRFDWDASSVTQPNGPSLLTYTLTAQDSSGATLTDDLGRPLVQNGRIVFNANHAKRPVQLQQPSKLLNLDSDFAVSSYLSYNAFGELSEERDERVAERTRALLGRELTADELAAARTSYRYNTLGKLITRTEAQTGVTADNGFAYRARPVTTYSYDLLGRMTVQMDANGARSVRTLLEGTTDAVVRLANVERAQIGTTNTPMAGDLSSRRDITYNIFGEAEKIRNEGSRNTLQNFDKLGRLVQVRHEVDRLENTKAQTYDAYTYDALGQKIKHVQYAGEAARPTKDASGNPLASDAITADDQVTRTDYDGLGRVVTVLSAAGFLTGYEYGVISVTGLNGTITTGTHRITRLPTNKALIDDTDYFGHLTAHRDQSGMVTTYRYDAAARLLQQTSTVHAGQAAGQDIRYTYYANGAVKTQADATVQTCTDFSYDDAGNRSGETYHAWVGGRRVGTYQSNTLAYDELGRVLRVSDGNDYSVRYEYDAVGNRRLVDASYWDATAGARKPQTYWYKYNNLNQVQVTKGTLVGVDGKPHERGTGLLDTLARIEAGQQGMTLEYNALGERTLAAYFAKNPDKTGQPFELLVETYANDTQGHVLEVKRNSKPVMTRRLDAAGRTLEETGTGGSTYTYDKDNRLLKQGGTTFLYDNGDAAPSATGAGPLVKTVSGQGSNLTTTTYTYEYWDDARQKTVQKTDAAGTGTIELSYNANGHLVREEDTKAKLSTTFLNSANGLVLQRERLQNQVAVGSHLFFYADGKRVGEIRNDPSDITHPTLAEEQQKSTGSPPDNTQLFRTFKPVVSADFDQNFSPVNHGEPGPAGGSYTVRDGDTLQGVAQQIWGDSSLWYLIAEANGMAGTETLRGGQVLRIPNGVTTIHNNSQTLRPYNPAEVIGNLDPTILRPAPPVTRCGALSAIIGVVVAVVVSIYTVNPAAGAVAGDAARQYSSAALNDRLDWGHFFREGLKLAVLGQVSPLAAGIYTWKHREHPPGFTGENTYDYKSTVIAGLAGLASQGAGIVAQGAPSYVRAALQAGAAATTRQGLNFAAGRTEDFSWRAVMASAIGAAAGAQATGYLGDAWGDVLGEGGARAGGNLAGGLLEQRLLKREQRDYRGVFISTLGGIIGDAISPQRPGLTNRERLRSMAPSYASGDVGERVPVLTMSADGGSVGDFVDGLEGMMQSRAAADLSGVEWNKYADGSAPDAQGGTRLDVPHIVGTVVHGGPPDPQRDASEEAIARMLMRRLRILQAAEAQDAALNEGQGTGYGVMPSLPESVGDIALRDPLSSALFSESVQSFQETNDQKVAAGTYKKFGEIGSALSDGQFGAAWQHIAFEASDAAKAELAARQYLPASRDAQRLDLMRASPIGAIASLVTGALGGNQNWQDAALIGGSIGESVVGGMLGLPRTIAPVRSPLGTPPRRLGGSGHFSAPAPGDADFIGPLTALDTKILFGAGKPGTNNFVGGHSPDVLKSTNYKMNPAVVVNRDGTVSVTDFKGIIIRKDGSIGFSKAKSPNIHTIAPTAWSNADILKAGRTTAGASGFVLRDESGVVTTVHTSVIRGVEWQVVKENSVVTSSFPTGGRPILPQVN